MLRTSRVIVAVLTLSAPFAAAAAEIPDAIAAKGEMLVLQVHAEGAQIYECKADAGGKLAWQFREPIASLFSDGKTAGRHGRGIDLYQLRQYPRVLQGGPVPIDWMPASYS